MITKFKILENNIEQDKKYNGKYLIIIFNDKLYITKYVKTINDIVTMKFYIFKKFFHGDDVYNTYEEQPETSIHITEFEILDTVDSFQEAKLFLKNIKNYNL